MRTSFLALLIFTMTSLVYPQQSNTNLVLAAPTNMDIKYEVDLTNIQIGKPFSVIYTMPDSIMSIIAIDSNINALGDTDIAVTNLSSTQLDLTVTSYGVQPYPMPSLLITALDQQSNTNQFYTPSFDIPVSNDIISNTNLILEDIEPIYFVWDHLWTILIIVFLLFILGLIFIPKMITPREKKVPVVIIDPFVQVSTKLKTLKVKSLELTEETYKEFFVDLSETIREFMSETLVPLALELPTRELVATMKKIGIQEELLEITTVILRNTDRAKYAKQIFSQERITEVTEDCFKMVKLVQRKIDMEKNDELRKS